MLAYAQTPNPLNPISWFSRLLEKLLRRRRVRRLFEHTRSQLITLRLQCGHQIDSLDLACQRQNARWLYKNYVEGYLLTAQQHLVRYARTKNTAYLHLARMELNKAEDAFSTFLK